MVNKSSIISITALLCSLLALAVGVFQTYKRPKLGYVKSKELFEGYLGTKEAKSRYSKNSELMAANADTLAQQFNRTLADFNANYNKLNAKEREEKKRLLSYQKQNLDKYNETVEAKIQEEDQKLTQGVLNQVNTFITEYGKRNGYSIIFGTNLTGNIIYGDEAHDLTTEVLKELNVQYKSSPNKQ